MTPSQLQALCRALRSGWAQSPELPDFPELHQPGAGFIALIAPDGAVRRRLGGVPAREPLGAWLCRCWRSLLADELCGEPLDPEELAGLRLQLELIASLRPLADPSELRPGEGLAWNCGSRCPALLPASFPDPDSAAAELRRRTGPAADGVWLAFTILTFREE